MLDVHSTLVRTSPAEPPSARDETLDALYRRHAPFLLRLLLSYTDDFELAEDVVGETFVRLLRSPGRYEPGRAAQRTWMATIALNCLRSSHRRTAAERRALTRVAAGMAVEEPTWPERIAERDALDRAMRTLSAVEREVIVGHYDDGLRISELAARSGRPAATIESRVTRALAKLRAELARRGS